MKTLAMTMIALIILAAGLYAFRGQWVPFFYQPKPISAQNSPYVQNSVTEQNMEISLVAANLRVPWEIAFLPEGDLLVTERPGTLKRTGRMNKSVNISGVYATGEGGLLGMALDPDFSENRYLYLYLTTRKGGNTENEVRRYVYTKKGELQDETILLAGMPGAGIHNGGRILFGPDGYLYVSTGDAAHPALSQDKNSLAGKILRITKEGRAAPGNPFASMLYAYGLRNPQGLAWDAQGRLWATDHGASGHDELNLIRAGGNYGWPDIQGDETSPGMITPAIHSGRDDTWAPSGAAFSKGHVFFAGLRGQALYDAEIDPESAEVLQFSAHLRGTLGRIRNVVVGPDGFLYLMTSNKDGRGRPKADDDKIVRINLFQG